MTFGQNQPERNVSISETNETFDYWLQRPYITPEIRAELQRAEVLMVPQEEFRGRIGTFFPEGASELLRSLQGNSDGVVVDICADDQGFNEKVLHFELIDLGQWVVSTILSPLLVNWLWGFLQSRHNSNDTQVTCQLTVQASNGSPAIRIDYQGPAAEFQEVVEPLLRNIPQEQAHSALPPAPIEVADQNER